MSNVNIKRAVENIRSNTTVYTPIVEVIVNAIQAIASNGGKDGKIAIRVHRAEQLKLDGGLPEVLTIEVEDNGIGFTDENRQSFDTLYTDLKINEGGKGFGRFTCLKYFENLHVESVYRDKVGYTQRRFSMGKSNDIIVNEKISESTELKSKSVILLDTLNKEKSIEKKLTTIARILVEKLLPYFITKDYVCPEILLSERDGSDSIRLNDYLSNDLSAVIKEIPIKQNIFTLKGAQAEEEFLVRVFKLYFPKNQKSKNQPSCSQKRSIRVGNS